MNVPAGMFADYCGQIGLAGQPASIHSPRDAQQLGIGMIHQELNLELVRNCSRILHVGRLPVDGQGPQPTLAPLKATERT